MKRSHTDGLIDVVEGDTRTVTPDNPLVVESSPVTYKSVTIEGGQIFINIAATVTFDVLVKSS